MCARAVPSWGWMAATISSRRFGWVAKASIMYGDARPRAEVDVREIRRADGVRFVAAGRKHEELARPLFGRQQHVGFHVHEHTAAERQTLAAVPLAHHAGPAQQRLLDDRLRAARDR